MSFRRQTRQVFESVGFCLGFPFIGFLPRRQVVRFANWLGEMGYRYALTTKRVAMANLDVAFGGTRSQEEKTAIAKEAFRTFALVTLDFFWFSVFKKRRLQKWVIFEDSVRHAFEAPRVVVVTGHFGNWEIMGQAAALRGKPLASVVAPIKNPFVDRMMNRVRGRTGQEMVGKNGAMRKLLRRLKKGGGAALVVDQNVLPRDGGEFVQLFGLPVPTTRAAGILMERASASIAFCYCTADDSGTYYVRGLPPLSVGETRDSGRNVTQWIVEMIERVIRENPGRWLWMYKRWKYVPEGISRERYPFYAKPAPGTDSSRRQRQQGGAEA